MGAAQGGVLAFRLLVGAGDDLRALNPALVVCSVTGFGQTGPYADRPGYDYVIQAMSGLMSITGPVEGPSYKVGVAISSLDDMQVLLKDLPLDRISTSMTINSTAAIAAAAPPPMPL